MRRPGFFALVLFAVLGFNPARADEAAPGPYAQWKNGPSASPDYFPIGVWLQDPGDAAKFQAVGFNLFVGLWLGPTPKQLAALAAAGMPVLCAQNRAGLKFKDNPIAGWTQVDEPDNSQPRGKKYGPPITPQKIVAEYQKLRKADPTRPVLLGLGQGVAWDAWYGRGVRTDHPEDYPEYVKGCDIASFDIYPVNELGLPSVPAGPLWYVANGVSRLKQWAGTRPVWNCIECTCIDAGNQKPTSAQVKAEVWLSLINGSQGLIYFTYQFTPTFDAAALLADPEMTAEVTALNQQIQSLASVLNSPTVSGSSTVEVAPEDPDAAADSAPVDFMLKQQGGATYLFATEMNNITVQATFAVAGLTGAAEAEVLGEERTLEVSDGVFTDTFNGYDVHLYKITPANQ